MVETNWMQTLQNEGTVEFVIQGVDDWHTCLARTVKLKGTWIELCGGSEVSLIDYARKEAEINNQSFERSVFTAFVRLGYRLEELEVEIHGNKDERSWGRCIWYKEHPAYQEPIPVALHQMRLEPNLYHAIWKTEHAGDQHYCIYSVQVSFSAWLPNKTLIFRRVVFSPPSSTSKQAT